MILPRYKPAIGILPELIITSEDFYAKQADIKLTNIAR